MITLSVTAPPTSPSALWVWLAIGVTAGVGLLAKWGLGRARKIAVVSIKPLDIDQLVHIMYPDPIDHHIGFPNIETPLKGQAPPSPAEPVPHVPSVCRSCNVMDALPEDGNRPTRMHWSGLCMLCYEKTPEGQAAALAGGPVS